MSLVIVGTVAFDTIETPFGRVEKVIGGSGTYFSWAASNFHNDIKLVSIIGSDWPKEELAAMQQRGIDTRGIEIVEDGKSFFWAGRYHEDMNGRDTLTTDLNVLDDFDPDLPADYRNAEYLMLGNLTPEIQMQVISQMNADPKLIAMDTMNFWMDVAWDSLLKAIEQVDLLMINDEEARQLSGEYSLVNAAEKILTMGPSYLIIKKGEHGALLFGKEGIFVAPALPLAQIKDPTGAGDTFAGGLMGYLASSGDISFENMKRGIIKGSALASYCVEDFSLDRLRTVTDIELQERVNTFRDIVTF